MMFQKRLLAMGLLLTEHCLTSLPGESHLVGRAAPEIDIFEAQIGIGFSDDGVSLMGEVSQSGQWAPFNAHYQWFNTTDNLIIEHPPTIRLNSYTGATGHCNKRQQECQKLIRNAISVVVDVSRFEYKPGFNAATYVGLLFEAFLILAFDITSPGSRITNKFGPLTPPVWLLLNALGYRPDPSHKSHCTLSQTLGCPPTSSMSTLSIAPSPIQC
ncbi:hypothetical protein E1B28_000910 [Marasmius oreades]|uniref:Uncharacterized protein n=1 Tax=Marasmius oreades TaxID=181124 RepID=A0A9P8AF42_9AGAR|nr:uncharacterized protein E1B28_000910 [Marasmius oreades]KAG7099030.1 hypothetical protein E1B28_000910 [Marasmius oreades]